MEVTLKKESHKKHLPTTRLSDLLIKMWITC